jgi:TatD DNase family protein
VSINLVDFHCHLDLYPDHAAAIMECERGGVHALTVTTTPKAWPRNHELTTKTHFVRAALGLHPQLVAQRANEIQLWETYLSQTRYVGEIGLDAGPKYYQSFDLQKKIFARILHLCDQAGNKILSIHSVRASSVVLDMIEKYMHPDHSRIVLHWFTGSKSDARRAVDLGCYFSINAEMLRKVNHRVMVATLPLNRILTETDGPFCQHNGHPIHPLEVTDAINLIAPLINMKPEIVTRTICENLVELENI